MNVLDFQRVWGDPPAHLTERAAAQSHFNDLCALFGQPKPTDDPDADYTFERGVRKLGGGAGFADVWKRSAFAWEYKRPGGDLDAAYVQLHGYVDDLANPPLLVCCDLVRFDVHTNFTGRPAETVRFTVHDLSDPETLDVLRRVFTDPWSFGATSHLEAVTKEAAARFGDLAAALRARGIAPMRAAHFLVQILFCLFAEDVGLLPRGLFGRLLRLGAERPAAFAPQAATLFAAMRDGGVFGVDVIARFNGGLFAESDPVDLTARELADLAKAADLDWAKVEPAIFGTLFERALDPDTRAALGAHYTGRADIERVVEPVVLAPLQRDWDALRPSLESLVQARDAAPTTQTRRNREAGLRAELGRFQQRLADVRVLDPACGSGNFLYIALVGLLDLERRVLAWAAARGIGGMLPAVHPAQMLGLEINRYARELAQAAVWIGYLQWMIAAGFTGRRDPILEPLETIRLQDALLDLSDPEHPKEAEWPRADFIIGNPPFLGGKRIRTELGDSYTDTLFDLFEDKVPKEADLVCYFFEQARKQLADGIATRAGLLATNSIRGGANRHVLSRIKKSGDIFSAWSDEPSILDGAAVRISIVCFDDGSEIDRKLNGNPVIAISSNLSASLDITNSARLPQNFFIAYMGDTLGGPFNIDCDTARAFLAMPTNPNGRPNSDVVRPRANGHDLLRRPRDEWVIDFGVDMPESEAALYESPFEYVRKQVKPLRDANRRDSYRLRW
ncbi:MAG: class I SAM-dependent DNA methyltransferase [Thermomicrobiales bacterium]